MERNWFSNFVPFDQPMVCSGIRYTTVEHFFQAMKTLDQQQRQMVASCATPAEAKHAGRKVTLRADWDTQKEKVMLFALQHKFREGTVQRKKLLATTGELVEVNYWHDNFWGACSCERCHGKVKHNRLGKMLTAMREELLKEV